MAVYHFHPSLIFPSHRKSSPDPVKSYSAADIVSARSEIVVEAGSSIPVQIIKILQAKHHPSVS